MFKSKNIAFIVNPAAAGGAAGRDWPRIESLVRDRLGPFQSYLTASRGDGIQLARRAILDEGADLVVCVGGSPFAPSLSKGDTELRHNNFLSPYHWPGGSGRKPFSSLILDFPFNILFGLLSHRVLTWGRGSTFGFPTADW